MADMDWMFFTTILLAFISGMVAVLSLIDTDRWFRVMSLFVSVSAGIYAIWLYFQALRILSDVIAQC